MGVAISPQKLHAGLGGSTLCKLQSRVPNFRSENGIKFSPETLD